jgi:hypothetical protein
MLMFEFILSQINPFHILGSYYLTSILIIFDHLYLGLRSYVFPVDLGAMILLVARYSSEQRMSIAAHSVLTVIIFRVTYPFAVFSRFLDSFLLCPT